jgi:hypothetical protein
MPWGRWRLAAALALAAPLAACSLTLDFSDKQIPIDAATDAPYTADECAFDEPNDTPDTAAMVTPADTGPAAICPMDLDYYSFVVPADATAVKIKILFTNRPTGDLDLKLFDSTGSTMIAQSTGFADNEEIDCPAMSPSCPALTPGDTYVFEVYPAQPTDVNFYSLDLEFTPPT